MHTDYVWHIPALVASMWSVSVYWKLKELSGGTLRQAGLLSRATAGNSCRKKYLAFKTVFGQHPIPQGSRETGYSFFFFLYVCRCSMDRKILWQLRCVVKTSHCIQISRKTKDENTTYFDFVQTIFSTQ